MILPDSIKIVEVSPRDGLQNESTILATEDKVRLIYSLVKSGLSNIEVTSFVNPKLVPQLADAELLLEKLPWSENITYNALIPNLKGFGRSQNTKLKDITLFISASQSHNKANVNCSISESLEKLEEVCKEAIGAGISVKGEIAVSFGCPFEGEVKYDNVAYIVKNLYAMGCRDIILADTIGIANPKQVHDRFTNINNLIPELKLAAHFHDTNKMALANILAAMMAGVTMFDSSIGGLGGCPFVPGATGNVATENVVYMMDKMGINTGIDIKKLMGSIKLVEKLFSRNIELIPELQKIKKGLNTC